MLFIKRVAAVCVSLVLVVLSFSACMEKKSASGNGTPDDLAITVWNTQGSDYIAHDYEKNVVADWLYEKTKVKVDSIYGNDGGQWDMKLTKLIAGNNLPDIVWCQAGQGSSHFSKLDQMGKIWTLTPEMLQQYAPHVWERTPDDIWEAITVDGKILGIPFNLPVSRLAEVSPQLSEEEVLNIRNLKSVPTSDVVSDLWIRDDILQMIFPEAKSYDELVSLLEERGEPIGDELLDIPIYTTEEYIKFMYDIQNLNLTENGRKIYAYGYAGNGNDNWEPLTLLGAAMHGYKGHAYPGVWNNQKKEIEIPLTGDLLKQAAKSQNEMINDGVIDPESLAHTDDQFKQKVYNGQYAICWFPMLGNTIMANNQIAESGKTFRYRPFITQVPAQPGYEASESSVAFGDAICFVKSLSEEELIRLLEWVDIQYTSEFEEIMYWGPKEAGLYKETSDGKREFNDERLTKFIIHGDFTAMQVTETMGLRVFGQPYYAFSVVPTIYSQWMPDIYCDSVKYQPTIDSGFKFPVDSPHVTGVKSVPPSQAYLSEYADIKETSVFWAAREQWEMEFKKAFAASRGEFDKKWSAAVDALNGIVDVGEMERKMNEVAKPLAEKIEKGSNGG